MPGIPYVRPSLDPAMPTRSTTGWLGCLFGALLVVSACGGSRSATSSMASTSDVNTFLQRVLETTPRLTYDDLVAQLGVPVREQAEAIDRPGAVQQDSLRTLIYYGLEVMLDERTSQLTRLALTGPRFTSPEGLRVGYAESQILSTLGRPTRQETTFLVYEKERPRPCVLMVILERDTVSRMEWRFTDE